MTLVLFDSIGHASAASSASAPGSAPAELSRDATVQLGWLFRNTLTMLALCAGTEALRVLLLPASAAGHASSALTSPPPQGVWLDVTLAPVAPVLREALRNSGLLREGAAAEDPSAAPGQVVPSGPRALPPGLTVVGWEANAQGLPGPRIARLRRHMDPAALAGQSALGYSTSVICM